MSNIKEMIIESVNNHPTKVKELFEKEMISRLKEVIEQKKIEVASTMFATRTVEITSGE